MSDHRNLNGDIKRIEGGSGVKHGSGNGSGSGDQLVSIVTVCFNSERYLERTIKSVVGQTYGNIEYIIIDGGSTDRTLDIIRKYEDHIAYWLSEPDRGIYDALNKGISRTTGVWVGIVHSDDWYHPGAVESIVRAYREDPQVDVLYGNLLYVRQKGAFLRREDCDVDGKYMTRRGVHENMLENWALYHPACFVKRDNYSENKFDPDLKFSADYGLMLALYMAGRKFAYIDEPVSYFRPVGTTETTQYGCVLENFHIRKRYDTAVAFKCWFLETKAYLSEVAYGKKEKIKRFFSKSYESGFFS